MKANILNYFNSASDLRFSPERAQYHSPGQRPEGEKKYLSPERAS